jgi:hypothetical protein
MRKMKIAENRPRLIHNESSFKRKEKIFEKTEEKSERLIPTTKVNRPQTETEWQIK